MHLWQITNGKSLIARPRRRLTKRPHVRIDRANAMSRLAVKSAGNRERHALQGGEVSAHSALAHPELRRQLAQRARAPTKRQEDAPLADKGAAALVIPRPGQCHQTPPMPMMLFSPGTFIRVGLSRMRCASLAKSASGRVHQDAAVSDAAAAVVLPARS